MYIKCHMMIVCMVLIIGLLKFICSGFFLAVWGFKLLSACVGFQIAISISYIRFLFIHFFLSYSALIAVKLLYIVFIGSNVFIGCLSTFMTDYLIIINPTSYNNLHTYCILILKNAVDKVFITYVYLG